MGIQTKTGGARRDQCGGFHGRDRRYEQGACQRTYRTGFAGLFPYAKGTRREAVGTCPRCGGTVYEGKKGFFCEKRDCSFALWKDNKFFTGKKKTLTKTVAAALLKEGRVSMSGLYSEKTGRTYDAVVVLDDTGGKYVNFKLEFPARKGGRK